MTAAKTLRAKNPADLLAMVPYFLGFHPEDSVVVLTLGRADRPFHARMDLPADPAEAPALVDYLASVAGRHGLKRVAVMVYSRDAEAAAALGLALAARLEADGLGVPVALRADGDRWFCLHVPCDRGCPAEGTPYDVAAHPFTAEAVLDGRVTFASRDALRESLVGGDPAEVDAVCAGAAAALERFRAAARHPLGPPAPERARAHLVAEGHWVGHRVRQFLGDRLRLGAEDVGRLLVALTSIEVRDVAWAEMTRANAADHVDLWRDVVRRSPLELLAPPAALLGFAAWLLGDGALAWCAVDRCREADPDYSLAGLLAEALAGAVPPSTWQPPTREHLTLFAG